MRNRVGNLFKGFFKGALFVAPVAALTYRAINSNLDDPDMDEDLFGNTGPYLDNFGFYHTKHSVEAGADSTSANEQEDDIALEEAPGLLVDTLASYLQPESLKPKSPYSDAFIAELVYQIKENGKDCLNKSEVENLAKRAMTSSRIIELEILARHYPDVLTEEFIECQLNTIQIPAETYTQLLRVQAEGKLQALAFLFNPENEIVIVEVDDKAGLKRAVTEGQTDNIVVANTEPYEPSFSIINLRQTAHQHGTSSLSHSGYQPSFFAGTRNKATMAVNLSLDTHDETISRRFT